MAKLHRERFPGIMQTNANGGLALGYWRLRLCVGQDAGGDGGAGGKAGRAAGAAGRSGAASGGVCVAVGARLGKLAGQSCAM
jgi:hypothetical protein